MTPRVGFEVVHRHFVSEVAVLATRYALAPLEGMGGVVDL